MRKIIVAALAFLVMASSAFAAYPEKSIQVVIPWGPGGSSDISARIVADKMKKYLPQPLVITNLTGALGLNGARQVLNARPDGYTLLWEHPGNLAVAPIVTKSDFRWNDLEPVCTVVRSDMVMIVPKDSPFKNAGDVFEAIKKAPGTVRWSIALNGVSHFAYLAMAESLGVDLKVILVPSPGDKARVVSMLGGNCDVTCVSYAAAEPYIKSGDIRPVAMVNSQRSQFAKDVPTLIEQGVNVTYDYLCAVFTTKGTPDEVREILAEAFQKVMKDPETIKALEAQSFTPDFKDRESTVKIWTEAATLYESLIKKYNLIK
ncbi:MAG: tripartite tricarboxylate transporter substrate binding protein [Desulfovibrio sp.]|nr:tripartite tricarboxylate transporter substrate binding protein [Desulfovibrio sp.]